MAKSVKLGDILKGLSRPTPLEERRYRIGRVLNDKNGKASVLTYVDARYVMDVLDEIVGAENWNDEYIEIKNNLYCRITIRLGDEVVSKMDVGVPSNFESEKGECSDAFKRCAVKFGIGRDLYHVGTLYAQCNQTRSGWALPIGWKPEDDNDRIDTFHPTQLDKDHFVELMNSKIWTEDQRQKGLAWLDNINDQLTKVEWDNKISRMESHIKGAN